MIYDFHPVTSCTHQISIVDDENNIKLIDYSDNCPICLNVRYYYDYQNDDTGESLFLRGVDKPRLDVNKLMNTHKGDNVFQPNYGLTTQELIGEKKLSPAINRARKDIVDSLNFLLSAQQVENYREYLDLNQTIVQVLTSDIEEYGETTLQTRAIFELGNGVVQEENTVLQEPS